MRHTRRALAHPSASVKARRPLRCRTTTSTFPCQILRLEPYHRNLTSQVVKSPKIYWTDLGLLRQGTGQWQATTGDLFESWVVSEVHKCLDTLQLPARMSFYRTRSGMEVDLLLENEAGVLGCRCVRRQAMTRPRPVAARAAPRVRAPVPPPQTAPSQPVCAPGLHALGLLDWWAPNADIAGRKRDEDTCSHPRVLAPARRRGA
ncbi:MAG: DUF4143 domain-containing protein [Polyangiales bacterium]